MKIIWNSYYTNFASHCPIFFSCSAKFTLCLCATMIHRNIYFSYRFSLGAYKAERMTHHTAHTSSRGRANESMRHSIEHNLNDTDTHTLSECQLHSRSSEWTNMHIVECAHSTQITLTIGIDEWQKAPGDREQRVFPCNKDHNRTRKTMTESITMSWILLWTDVFVHDDARSRCGLVHAQQWRFDADERRHFARTTTDRSVQLSVSSLRPQNATTAYAMRTLCVCHLQ